MPTNFATNRAARDAIIGRVKQALGKRDNRLLAESAADNYVVAHAHGPRPTMPADLLAKFMARASDMESTVERIAERREIPAAVARYLDALVLPAAIAEQKSHAGVCWPEFADLDWTGCRTRHRGAADGG